ncbi:MAG TPA: bacteriohemerythrin [Rhodocyclaceae bacterium]
MSLIRWTDKFAVNQSLIDDQHRYLFQLINDFHDAYMQRQTRQDVLILLNRLIDYAQRHFEDEERIMAEKAYPQLEAHQALHVKLFEEIFALNEKLADRALNPTRDTIAFLKNWLTDHIMLHDLKFAEHLNASGAAGAGTAKV